ncbi:hypothetical protein BLNAU_18290 [Blattamonas nauphoetae]|uniref:Uncharacterized protein n=1 Tax=Blattamonas nauphoetae TaxID=2049346 RepID=A0ABQ9X4S2_9EUKA|nr:hypothetical protein BLNAU_18290 [Blattamonas nauphoetae]
MPFLSNRTGSVQCGWIESDSQFLQADHQHASSITLSISPVERALCWEWRGNCGNGRQRNIERRITLDLDVGMLSVGEWTEIALTIRGSHTVSVGLFGVSEKFERSSRHSDCGDEVDSVWIVFRDIRNS